MKKILNLIFSMALCAALAACSNNQAANIDDNSKNSSLPVSPMAPTTTTDDPIDSDETMDTVSGEYQFAVNNDNTVTITKYTGEGGDVKIPAEIDGKKVTAIGNTFKETGAFQDCGTLTSVIIPDGVTEIQDRAFQGCASLKWVTIPASVTLIRNGAFDSGYNLQSIYFEGNAPQIADDTFTAESTNSLTFFYHEGASGWTDRWYGYSTATYLASGDFYYNVNDSSFASQITHSPPNTVTITKYIGRGGDVIIPAEIDGKKVTGIGNIFQAHGAFQDCTTLTSVVIPDGVTQIQDNAFYSCTSLVTVTIPASVTLLRNCAFADCPNLQSIYFEGDAPQIANYVLDPPLPTIYYHEGTVGWVNPWHSCPTETY